MAYCVDVECDSAADDDEGRSARPQKLFGGFALGSIAFACVWTLYTNLFASPPVDILTAPTVTVLAARPTAAPLPSVPTEPLFDIALLDATYSLGLPPVTFSPGAAPKVKSGFRAVALNVPHADIPVAPGSPPSPAAVRLVQSVPLPAPRPSGLRSPAAADTPFQKLFGKPEPGPALAYAAPDGGVFKDGQSLTSGRLPPNDGLTAIYDITARTVYLPDGTKLEAHSGLREKMDDPNHVHVKMRGATPPHVYDLVPREALFHGVEALRLIPAGGESAIFGRTGLLAHSYLLGPNGDSNGCVSFADYAAFLRAYKDGKVKRMIVVASVDDPQLDLRVAERRPLRGGRASARSSFETSSSQPEDDRYALPAFNSSLASRTSSSARSLN